MTKLLFIRYTAHDFLGEKIPGRLPGVHLNALGMKQAEQLGERLSTVPIGAIYCSHWSGRARQLARSPSD
jgi:broad specificity phosphatase PhoE